MRIQGDLVALSKTAALRLIEEKLGFPNPSPRFLHWYFRRENHEYLPIVDFDLLAKEIEEKDLVSAVSTVVGLAPDDAKKIKVLCKVQEIIQKHELEEL